MIDYPRRDAFFAHKFVRVLHKSCAAQDIGPAACYLLCVIVHTEDAGRYCGPARFWRSQLMETLGFRSPKQLVSARNRAIEFGWLAYRQNGTRGVGEYFVTIPEQFSGLTDAPIESSISFPGGTNNGTNQSPLVPLETQKRNGNGTMSGTQSGPPPNPIPTPIPNTRASADDRPQRKTQAKYTEAFELWWESYPWQDAKAPAAKAFPKALKAISREKNLSADEALSWLIDRTNAFAASDKGRSEFIPHGAKWLNEARYDDDPKAWQQKGTKQQMNRRVSENDSDVKTTRWLVADLNGGAG